MQRPNRFVLREVWHFAEVLARLRQEGEDDALGACGQDALCYPLSLVARGEQTQRPRVACTFSVLSFNALIVSFFLRSCCRPCVPYKLSYMHIPAFRLVPHSASHLLPWPDISINVGIVIGYLVAFLVAETVEGDSESPRPPVPRPACVPCHIWNSHNTGTVAYLEL